MKEKGQEKDFCRGLKASSLKAQVMHMQVLVSMMQVLTSTFRHCSLLRAKSRGLQYRAEAASLGEWT
jgi:hypothetical protein